MNAACANCGAGTDVKLQPMATPMRRTSLSMQHSLVDIGVRRRAKWSIFCIANLILQDPRLRILPDKAGATRRYTRFNSITPEIVFKIHSWPKSFYCSQRRFQSHGACVYMFTVYIYIYIHAYVGACLKKMESYMGTQEPVL